MNRVNFNYNDDTFIIQCNNDDKMKDIISKFFNKLGNNKRNIFFLYNGQIINEELTFDKCANSLDRSRNCINVVVLEGQKRDDESKTVIKSDYIICPICNENAYLSIKDFKINIYGCKSGHKTENLQINELQKTQYIDQSKIKCDMCNSLISEINENKFFTCYICKCNLCPSCKDIHEESHKSNIKSYEENQFNCNVHFEKYSCYCDECKIDICSLCKNEHENHKIITYDSIMPDIEIIKNNELKETKEKIYELKSIINSMQYQLNKLNKNLDIYFDIYNNIISTFNKEKKNYFLINNVNNMNKYNNNFLRYISETTKDNNLKSQFTSIINLQTKIEFKKSFKNIEKEIIETNIIEENNVTDNNINDNNIQKNLNLENNYNNINITKLKELQSFTTKYEINKLLVLNDGRILTKQVYYDENYEGFYKLCVYSTKNNNEFTCDIIFDCEDISDFYLMDNGYVVIYISEIKTSTIKIIKFEKNNIKEIWKMEKGISKFKKLSNNLFYIRFVFKTDRMVMGFFGMQPDFEHKAELYLYDNKQLLQYKDINELYQKEKFKNLCQINDNEIVFYVTKKGKLYGENDFLIFYDIKMDKEIKILKIGNGENSKDMLLINKENLFIERDENIIIIDTQNRNIKKKLKILLIADYITILNEKLFLHNYKKNLSLYEVEGEETIKLKETISFEGYDIVKYPDNRLIDYSDKKIIIYGY